MRDPVEHWGHLLVQEMQHTWLEQPGTGRLWHLPWLSPPCHVDDDVGSWKQGLQALMARM